MYLCYITLMDN